VIDGPAGGSRTRTVFLGSGGFAVPSLRGLARHPDVDLVGVVTAPPRAAGRKQELQATPVQAAAEELAIPAIVAPERLRARDGIVSVLALEPDLLVLADYGQIVPAALLGTRHGALNVHPSLLPRHRGATPIPAAILAGDGATGVTVIRMDDGLDTGPIVAQESLSLAGTETTPELEAVLAAQGADLLDRTVGPWLRGEIEARPQPDGGATLTRPLRREDGRLDPVRPAVELQRQVRAYQPWPGSYLDTPFGRLVVWAAMAEGGGPATGTFDALGIGVGSGDRLRLIEVQPAGGRRMPWDVFLRGRASIPGSAVLPGP
jgi:methionyl-tRNA formyltransferase